MKKLTPFQYGLLNGINRNKMGGFYCDLYKHLRPASKRSFNILINRGYLALDCISERYIVTESGKNALN